MSDTVQIELEVMGAIAAGLQRLEDNVEAKRRVLQWATSHFLPDVVTVAKSMNSSPSSTQGQGEVRTRAFDTLPDLYGAISPASEADRALVVGYWFQVLKGEQDLDGFMINKELRHLGHGAGNITNALTSLMQRKPQLVIQTRKSGNSKQARKLYRLTDAGIKTVERMLSGQD